MGKTKVTSCWDGKRSRAAEPNTVYVLLDDLGIGSAGCYGQRLLKTTRIDRLAAEGMRFTKHDSHAAM